MNTIPQALLMSTSIQVFLAPLVSATTNTDITVNPISPVTTVPAGTTITYGTSDTVFNNLSAPASYPSISWGVSAKLNASLYPTKTITVSAYINAIGITQGSGSSTNSGPQLRYYWAGGNLDWYFYITPGGSNVVYVYWRRANGTQLGANIGALPAGENFYSVEWTPAGDVTWKINNVVKHSITGFDRENQNGGIYTRPAVYDGAYYGGVYESTIRNVSYTVS